MRRKPQLSDEELALWAHVAAGVRPLPGRKPPVAPSPAPAKVEAGAKPAALSAAAASDLRPATTRIKPLVPLERRMRQRVSRGQSPIDGVLDLHGLRQDEAHRALLAFVHRKAHEGASVVMVITGKGGAGGAADRGVLKRMAPHWLADPGQRRYVLGFEDAAPHHGGSGAMYVRLRRIRED